MESILPILPYVVGVLLGIIGYLLKKKDDEQGEFIKDLYLKHEDDMKALQSLSIKLAERHYEKPELDALFKLTRDTMKEGFGELKSSIERLQQRS